MNLFRFTAPTLKNLHAEVDWAFEIEIPVVVCEAYNRSKNIPSISCPDQSREKRWPECGQSISRQEFESLCLSPELKSVSNPLGIAPLPGMLVGEFRWEIYGKSDPIV